MLQTLTTASPTHRSDLTFNVSTESRDIESAYAYLTTLRDRTIDPKEIVVIDEDLSKLYKTSLQNK